MKELTNQLPKPMLRLQGRPVLEHIIGGLAAAGLRQYCIVTGWRPEVLEDYFGDGARWGVSIQYARQEVQDGTGTAPLPAKGFVGQDPFLLTYGDILVEPQTYQHMLQRFASGDFAGVITVARGEDVTKGAINFFDPEFCLTRLVEKPTPAQLEQLRAEGWLRSGDPAWYNAGIYIFRPVVYEHIARLRKSPRGEYELTDAIIGMTAAGCRLAGLEIRGRWVDVRDPGVLAALEQGRL